MSTTLVQNPLRMSLSMTSGHDAAAQSRLDGPDRPLGYLFATWSVIKGSGGPLGHYDPRTQTWVTGRDDIIAGVPTRTRVRHTCMWVTDDSCF